eukprot:8413040-Ditylum_brightwellii.AAC.1
MEEYIDALYYLDIYGSEACWKTAGIVDTELKKLTSKIAKLRVLKENIWIQTIGLGWKDLSTTWSNYGVEHTPTQLALHPNMMTEQE